LALCSRQEQQYDNNFKNLIHGFGRRNLGKRKAECVNLKISDAKIMSMGGYIWLKD
jgi:hypothetical protein